MTTCSSSPRSRSAQGRHGELHRAAARQHAREVSVLLDENLNTKLNEYGIYVDDLNTLTGTSPRVHQAPSRPSRSPSKTLIKTRTEQEQALVIANTEAQKQVIAAQASGQDQAARGRDRGKATEPTQIRSTTCSCAMKRCRNGTASCQGHQRQRHARGHRTGSIIANVTQQRGDFPALVMSVSVVQFRTSVSPESRRSPPLARRRRQGARRARRSIAQPSQPFDALCQVSSIASV